MKQDDVFSVERRENKQTSLSQKKSAEKFLDLIVRRVSQVNSVDVELLDGPASLQLLKKRSLGTMRLNCRGASYD